MKKESGVTAVPIIRSKRQPYTVIFNGCLQDARLSFKARGLLAYMLSMQDGWEFYTKELVKHGVEGIDAIQSALNELTNLGYLRRNRRREKGKLRGQVWYVYDSPQPDNPLVVEKPEQRHSKNENGSTTASAPQLDYPELANPSLISTNSNKESNTSISSTTTIIKDNFEKLWKLYPNKKGKQAAFKHYRALAKKTKDPDFNKKIQDGIQAYKRWLVASNTEGQYIKQGSTFFNQESWDDDWSTATQPIIKPAAPAFDAKQWAIDTFASYGSVSATISQAKSDSVPIDANKIEKILTDYWAHDLGRDASSIPR